MANQKSIVVLTSSSSSMSIIVSKETSRWFIKLSRVLEKYRFNSVNLLKWRDYIEMILLSKKRLHHLTSTSPSEYDPLLTYYICRNDVGEGPQGTLRNMMTLIYAVLY